jgi:hypothetical protein
LYLKLFYLHQQQLSFQHLSSLLLSLH